MGVSATSNFPLTRSTIERLDGWLMELAAPLLPLKQTPMKLKHIAGFVYEFREQSERALVIGKAVRMVSGIRVALVLDAGRVTGVVADSTIGPIEVRADLVIGADGRASVIRKRAGLHEERS